MGIDVIRINSVLLAALSDDFSCHAYYVGIGVIRINSVLLAALNTSYRIVIDTPP
ncbi:hypothetical protein [Edwardsiella ictaluri]|uniref:hypothetical protein n=1 Tax=Edwardsiella ictaluri TaxID=67780 RepID=UPI0018DE6A98|nr:hypothetical protein [Edwardsiella ictaluri]QPW29390.1 hypothetical protein F8539_04650 [Edwardsiella ictaluri]